MFIFSYKWNQIGILFRQANQELKQISNTQRDALKMVLDPTEKEAKIQQTPSSQSFLSAGGSN
jgi:hypothetical protein